MKTITQNGDKIQWYNIRKKGEKRWAAYQLTDGQFNCLQSIYEAKGPFKSLLQCMIKANK